MNQIRFSNPLKYLAGILAVLVIPAIVFAQQPSMSADGTLSRTTAVAHRALPLPGSFDILQTVQGNQGAKRKPDHTQPKLRPMKRARIDPSMVGYIDDSIVQSEVRLRFDDGFNDPRPDRAEYFYAGSNKPASSTDAVQRTLNFQQLYLSGEYAPCKFFSAFIMVPYRWIQPFFITAPGKTPDLSSGGGISDVQAGLKFAVFHSGSSNVTMQLRAYFPTGNGGNGFGTNHYGIEPMVLLYHRLSDRAAVEAEAGDTHPIGGTVYSNPPAPPRNFAGDVAIYGIGPSYLLIDRDKYRLAPVLELVGWHVFDGLETGANNQVQSAAGNNILNAKLGARLSFFSGNSIYAGYGRALTSDTWYRNLFRIEFRHAF